MWLDHITSSGLGLDDDVDSHPPLTTSQVLMRDGAVSVCLRKPARSNRLPGEISVVEPPDPIPNSEVKRSRADGSVHPHARVGHRQGFTPKPPADRLGVSSFSGFQLSTPAMQVSVAAGFGAVGLPVPGRAKPGREKLLLTMSAGRGACWRHGQPA